MTHEQLQELLAGYALHALSPEDIQALEAHLPQCETCQHELLALLETTAQLARGVRAVEPPAALGSRIFAALRPARRPLLAPRLWIIGSAAAAAALIVVLAGINLTLSHRLAVLRDRVLAQEQILVLLTSPSARTVALTGPAQGRVQLVYAADRKAGFLIVTNLDDPGRDLIYQLWLIAGQEPESVGVFRPVAGEPLVVPITADFARYRVIAITIERAPLGAQRPTTPPILVGMLKS